jgi:hypothetical protein
VGNKVLHYFVNVPMAQVLALRKGIMLVQQIAFTNFTIQTDCIKVVETMIQGRISSTSFAAIYDDCSILWTGYGRVKIGM